MSTTLERIWRRVLSLAGRGRVTLVESDSGPVQLLQVSMIADELRGDTPRLGEYGLSSNPPPGSDAILLFLAGERTNGVVIACGNQTYRMKGLATGEVAISDDKGQSVYLSAAGIQVNGGGLPLAITNTPHVSMDTALLSVTGAISAGGDVTSGGNATVAGTLTAGGLIKGSDFQPASEAFTYTNHKHNVISGTNLGTPVAFP